LTLGLVSSSANSAPSFAGPKIYRTGGFTYSVAIGDLNADGKPDMAAANINKHNPTVSVLLNRGDGTFWPKVDYRAGGSGPYSVAIGDLNGDGKPDLATANISANTASVLMNRGNGRFRAKADYGTGRRPYSVAIGDLNGDGKPELVTANAAIDQYTVSVLANRGDGSFLAKVDYATGRDPSSVAIADLNDDGKPDLATANVSANSVSVLMNTGDGSFRGKVDYRTGRRPSSVAIGDLNGDGKPDLATANFSADSVSRLLNRGDGRFRAAVDSATGFHPNTVAIGDLNGDGPPELVTANFLSVSVRANTGDGTFRPERNYEVVQATSVAIGDLNGDGRPELAVARLGERGQFDSGVAVLANATGFCGVPDVSRKELPTAKAMIVRADCRVGRIRRVHSFVVKGRVVSQLPRPGTILRRRSKVNLVVSRGRK
jgi:hypothetical protein